MRRPLPARGRCQRKSNLPTIRTNAPTIMNPIPMDYHACVDSVLKSSQSNSVDLDELLLRIKLAQYQKDWF